MGDPNEMVEKFAHLQPLKLMQVFKGRANFVGFDYSMIRRIIFGFLVILGILIIWNWSLLVYGINQGLGQLNIVWNARPVEEFLSDPQFPDSLKSKLRLIDQMRKFAIDSLGLKDTDNYKTLYNQKGEELMWVVTACAPFELKPKEWSFPVVGSVPYKGYFDKQRAIAEKTQLEKEGWASSRIVAGTPTLSTVTSTAGPSSSPPMTSAFAKMCCATPSFGARRFP